MTAPKPTLLQRIEGRVRHELGLPRPWVTRTLLGKELVLRAGTLIDQVDYDDAWIFACASHAELMFDVGANVGQSALLAFQAPSIRQIVLVEANWEALSIAAENLIRNQLSAKARFVGAFAADASNASIEFWTVGTGAAGSMYEGHAITAAKHRSVQTVPTIALDDLCDAYGVVPDLVKIDVEGAEAKVLAGSTRLAAKARSRFLIEMHSPPELSMERNAELVLEWARGLDHAAWYLSEGVRLDSPEPIKHRGRCHLLVQPRSWPYPVWLAGIRQSSPIVI